jgi:hypothetical protein
MRWGPVDTCTHFRGIVGPPCCPNVPPTLYFSPPGHAQLHTVSGRIGATMLPEGDADFRYAAITPGEALFLGCEIVCVSEHEARLLGCPKLLDSHVHTMGAFMEPPPVLSRASAVDWRPISELTS